MNHSPRTLLVFSRSRRQRLNVSGHFPMAPLGISTLAACLKAAGYSADLLDTHVFPGGDDAIREYLKDNQYDHVGFSAGYFSVWNAILLADAVKQARPETVVSLGGPAALFDPGWIIQYTKSFDVIVHGEGETSVVEIVKAIEEGKMPDGIPGTTFINNGVLESFERNGFITMDEVPRPLLELLPLKKYRLHPPFGVYPPGQYIESARGCPFNCIFCTIPREIRFRSPELVTEDVKWATRKYGVRELHFVDPTFTFSRERTLEISGLLTRNKTGVHWTCKTRCDKVDRELLEAMAAAGCYSISYGVETAVQNILDFYKKDISVESVKNALIETKRAGIRSLAYMLIGSPGETDESVKKTISVMRYCKPDFVLYAQMLPDPAGLRRRGTAEICAFPEKDVMDYYLGGKTDLLNDVGVTGIPQKQIRKWIARAFFDFYARPSYLLGRLKDIRSIHDILNYFRAFSVLLKDLLGLSKTVG